MLNKKYVDGRQVIWDASSLATFLSCPRKYQLNNLEGWQFRSEGVAPGFGKAVHYGLEELEKFKVAGMTKREATEGACHALVVEYGEELQKVEDKARGLLAALRAVVWKAEESWDSNIHTAIMPDGSPAIEIRFECPIEGTKHRFSGRIDRLVTIGNNSDLYISDIKTTKTALSDHYFKSYTLNTQIYAYIWACRHVLGLDVKGFMIDGVQTGVNFCRFGRALFNVTGEQIDEWSEYVKMAIQQAEGYHDKDDFPMNLQSCSGKWMCKYLEVCSQPPSRRQGWLEEDFKQVLHKDME